MDVESQKYSISCGQQWTAVSSGQDGGSGALARHRGRSHQDGRSHRGDAVGGRGDSRGRLQTARCGVGKVGQLMGRLMEFDENGQFSRDLFLKHMSLYTYDILRMNSYDIL